MPPVPRGGPIPGHSVPQPRQLYPHHPGEPGVGGRDRGREGGSGGEEGGSQGAREGGKEAVRERRREGGTQRMRLNDFVQLERSVWRYENTWEQINLAKRCSHSRNATFHSHVFASLGCRCFAYIGMVSQYKPQQLNLQAKCTDTVRRLVLKRLFTQAGRRQIF